MHDLKNLVELYAKTEAARLAAKTAKETERTQRYLEFKRRQDLFLEEAYEVAKSAGGK